MEVSPKAAPDVLRELVLLGSSGPKIRQGGSAKAGPVVTDNGMWIIDAPFKQLLLPKDLDGSIQGKGEDGSWEVTALAEKLKSLIGVLEVGLFYGKTGFDVASEGGERGGQKPIAAYFGMEDGSVVSR